MANLIPLIAVKIQNDSGEYIPPNSIVKVTSIEYVVQDEELGLDAETIHHVVQYDGLAGNILVTGDQQVEINGRAYAYADLFIYVAVDPAITSNSSSSSGGSGGSSGLSPGAELGPVPGQWWVGSSGSGFYAQGLAVQTITPPTNGSYADSIAMFFRTIGGTKEYWGMVRSPVSPGTLGSPTTLKFDVWLPAAGSTLSPKPLSVATVPALVGMTVTNRGCFTVSSSSSSGSSGGSGSSGSSISVPGIIKYDTTAGEWVLVELLRCISVVTSVSCGPGNTVTGNTTQITG